MIHSKSHNSNVGVFQNIVEVIYQYKNDFDSSYLTIKRLVDAERNEMNNFGGTILDLYLIKGRNENGTLDEEKILKVSINNNILSSGYSMTNDQNCSATLVLVGVL